MASIGQKDTEPERKVREFLHKAGLDYRVHVEKLPGTPDIVLPKHDIVVEVRGCFWHLHEGCDNSNIPDSNRTFWYNKLHRNQKRDQRNQEHLEEEGWTVFIVWECEITFERLSTLVKKIKGE